MNTWGLWGLISRKEPGNGGTRSAKLIVHYGCRVFCLLGMMGPPDVSQKKRLMFERARKMTSEEKPSIHSIVFGWENLVPWWRWQIIISFAWPNPSRLRTECLASLSLYWIRRNEQRLKAFPVLKRGEESPCHVPVFSGSMPIVPRHGMGRNDGRGSEGIVNEDRSRNQFPSPFLSCFSKTHVRTPQPVQELSVSF